MYALDLVHLTQRAICAIASFRRKLVKQPERAATVVVSPVVLLDTFFAFCYNAHIETNFVDAVWAMRCSTRSGKISEEL